MAEGSVIDISNSVDNFVNSKTTKGSFSGYRDKR